MRICFLMQRTLFTDFRKGVLRDMGTYFPLKITKQRLLTNKSEREYLKTLLGHF